jgi:hypothetical protein
MVLAKKLAERIRCISISNRIDNADTSTPLSELNFLEKNRTPTPSRLSAVEALRTPTTSIMQTLRLRSVNLIFWKRAALPYQPAKRSRSLTNSNYIDKVDTSTPLSELNFLEKSRTPTPAG